jgi:hypothetical protein
LICGSSFCRPAFVSTSPRAGQDLLDALAQVGLHVALHPRIAVDGSCDRRERPVVVGVLVDADPVLTEIDAVDLVAEQRLPDVRAAVAHARDPLQVLAGLDRDAVLLLDVRRRLAQPVHEEVALLEVRQQLGPERRIGHEARERRDGRERDRRAWPAQDRAQQAAVAALEDAQQRSLALVHPP